MSRWLNFAVAALLTVVCFSYACTALSNKTVVAPPALDRAKASGYAALLGGGIALLTAIHYLRKRG